MGLSVAKVIAALNSPVGVTLDEAHPKFREAVGNVDRYRRRPIPLAFVLILSFIAGGLVAVLANADPEKSAFFVVVSLGLGFWFAAANGTEYSKAVRHEISRLEAEE